MGNKGSVAAIATLKGGAPGQQRAPKTFVVKFRHKALILRNHILKSYDVLEVVVFLWSSLCLY